MKTKIAPTLSWLIENEWAQYSEGVYANARREARALLAVARAAEAYKNRCGIDLIRGGRDVPEGKRLIRAMDRLSRASRRSPRSKP